MSSEKPSITIYTDGGCDPNPGPGGWGAILLTTRADGSPYEREISGNEPDTTNNRMELTAALEALRALKQPCRVTLFTDSEYLKKGITEWLPGWIARNWRRGRDKPVQNEALWKDLHAETQRHEIEWQWVKGHAGHAYNERVDQLATAEIRKLTGAVPARPVQFEIALRIALSGRDGGWAARIADVQTGQNRVYTGQESKVTSSRLWLIAAREALRRAPVGSTVRLYTPDKYLYDGITRWVNDWQQRGWRTAAGEPVKHQDVWSQLAEENAQRQVEWVAEHESPPPLAEGLDRLADPKK